MKNFIERFKGNWTKYLIQFPFEWWVTLSFRYQAKKEISKKMLNAWTRNLIREERLQIAYFAVINEFNRIHLHLLALGRNRFGKTLLDVSVERWQKAWKAQSIIQPVYDIEGISEYFEKNIVLKDNTLSEVILFNIKLLKKVQKTKAVEIYKNTDNTKFIFNKIAHQSIQDKESVKTQMVELINNSRNQEVK
jgi:ferredoxin-fold anticodon binding domain-containing protein